MLRIVRRHVNRRLLSALIPILVVLAFWSISRPHFDQPKASDFLNFYQPLGHAIASGRGLVSFSGQFVTRYRPGFPGILAAVFWSTGKLGVPKSWGLMTLTLLSLSVLGVEAYLIGTRLWEPWMGVAATLAVVTYPFLLWMTREPLSEIPFLPLYGAAVFLTWRGVEELDRRKLYSWFGVGFFCGLAMLVRPFAIGLPVVLGAYVLINGRRRYRVSRVFGSVVMILAGAAVVVAPWEVLVYLKTGRVIPLSTSGRSAIIAGWTFPLKMKRGWLPVACSGSVEGFVRDFNRRAEAANGAGSLLENFTSAARAHPRGMAELLGWKVLRSFYATDTRRRENMAIMIQLPYGIVLALALSLLWTGGERRRRLALLFLMLLGYSLLVTTVVVSIVRYMVPTLALSLVAIPELFEFFRKRGVTPLWRAG